MSSLGTPPRVLAVVEMGTARLALLAALALAAASAATADPGDFSLIEDFDAGCDVGGSYQCKMYAGGGAVGVLRVPRDEIGRH